MKRFRWIKWLFCAVFAWGLVLAVEARKEEVTLVLVPREDTTTRIGLDIANRYPTLLVSYLVSPRGDVSLHGWTGRQWVKVSLADFAAGSFFKNGPSSALIVEKKGAPATESLIPPKEWCAEVSKVTTTNIRPLLHLVGRFYDFNHKDWTWFAKRYGQSIDAINPEGLNTSWYHKRLDEHFKDSTPVGSDDLQYWLVVRENEVIHPPVVEPIDLIEDPFTNAVPPAVVMGAGDVTEEQGVGNDAPKESAPVEDKASGEKSPVSSDSAE